MKRILVYVALTFGITWTLWITCGVATGAFETGLATSPVMVGVIALGMFVPLVGALLTNVIMGREHRMDLCLRPRIRGNVKYYLLAWLAPAVVCVLGAVVFFLVNPTLFDPTAGAFIQSLMAMDTAGAITADTARMLLAVQAVFAVLLAPFVNMIAAFGEEAGWRGMLFPALCEKVSPRMAVLVSGVIWGLWHAPATVMGHNYGLEYWGYPATGILSMVVFCTAAGSCLAWLRLRTQSVWPCALAHGAINAAVGLGLYFCTVGSTLTGPSPAGIIGGLPLLALGIWCWLRMPATRPQAEPSPASSR